MIAKLKADRQRYLEKFSIRNESVTPEEVLRIIQEKFPEYRSKDVGKLGATTIRMKKGFTRVLVIRGRGKDRFYVRKDQEGCLAFILTLGLAEIFNAYGQRDRHRIFQILKAELENNGSR